LVVHADDMGLCHSVNEATLEAVKGGMVTSASLMAPCPWFPEAVRMAAEYPEGDWGLHLTLTCEWDNLRWGPLAGNDAVPGLVDRDGYMHGSVLDVVSHASPAEVEAEIRAQVEHALRMGFKPTHLDSHMGTLFASPEFFEVYRKVALEYDIPYMSPKVPPPASSPVEEAIYKRFASYTPQLVEAGEILHDYLQTDTGGNGLEKRIEYWSDQVRALRPGVTQFIIHCGREVDELRAITGSYRSRTWDCQAWQSSQMREVLEAEGVILSTWKELARRRAIWRKSLITDQE
jgi:predicted glycoside hydrolase/deacetylase ChbG (UPF0249 family)